MNKNRENRKTDAHSAFEMLSKKHSRMHSKSCWCHVFFHLLEFIRVKVVPDWKDIVICLQKEKEEIYAKICKSDLYNSSRSLLFFCAAGMAWLNWNLIPNWRHRNWMKNSIRSCRDSHSCLKSIEESRNTYFYFIWDVVIYYIHIKFIFWTVIGNNVSSCWLVNWCWILFHCRQIRLLRYGFYRDACKFISFICHENGRLLL